MIKVLDKIISILNRTSTNQHMMLKSTCLFHIVEDVWFPGSMTKFLTRCISRNNLPLLLLEETLWIGLYTLCLALGFKCILRWFLAIFPAWTTIQLMHSAYQRTNTFFFTFILRIIYENFFSPSFSSWAGNYYCYTVVYFHSHASNIYVLPVGEPVAYCWLSWLLIIVYRQLPSYLSLAFMVVVNLFFRQIGNRHLAIPTTGYKVSFERIQPRWDS